MSDEAKWLIWSNEHRGWWRPKSAGYTGIIKEAGRYVHDEAFNICMDGGTPRAWSTGIGPYELMVLAPEFTDAAAIKQLAEGQG